MLYKYSMCLLESFLAVFFKVWRCCKVCPLVMLRLAFFLVLLIAGLEIRVEHLKWHIFVPLGRSCHIFFWDWFTFFRDSGCCLRLVRYGFNKKPVKKKNKKTMCFFPVRVFLTNPLSWGWLSSQWPLKFLGSLSMPIMSLGGELAKISFFKVCMWAPNFPFQVLQVEEGACFFLRDFPGTCWDIDGWKVSHCRHP